MYLRKIDIKILFNLIWIYFRARIGWLGRGAERGDNSLGFYIAAQAIFKWERLFAPEMCWDRRSGLGCRVTIGTPSVSSEPASTPPFVSNGNFPATSYVERKDMESGNFHFPMEKFPMDYTSNHNTMVQRIRFRSWIEARTDKSTLLICS